ncbi:MAG: bifunctional diaminohydroxyphosphoribosylaminopyrimidine deaminase/5-amino-6-(5-phosphoribosylamino)uracil reductase RibD, partial [Burkholderiaceae bacterium]|jgi:diaminohydroxyphosphoribosylaminopyrimidine deaminase/5-amino-6-(5-phosphoribosylamino)uracil reductase|nr:bifunctional diaminohydroxyphosphoribosylaminopyrimidine deaminase/5-amino-6-(5-phosphoribosylamino)uracil reductase RibD [Burkholderiaceae bacterium]
VLGKGRTQTVGQAHAEIMALRDAAACGHDVRGATVYVTLEPCAHQGRTGPCCDALMTAGVARVVAAVQDPNPRVAGQGLARLRGAGIAVDVGLREQQAREINLGFFSRMTRARPWVRVKSAASLDGRTALPSGASQWITSDAARVDGHAWRARASAVLTGIGTVLRDDPLLTARAPGVTRQPDLVILDSHLRTPLQARLWQAAGRRVLIYTTADTGSALAQRLCERGAKLMACPGADGRIDLAALLADLARREVNELHVEAGATLTGAFLRAGLADELLFYLAPLLLGDGPGIAALDPPAALADAVRWHIHDAQCIGPDLCLLARLADASV